MRIFGIEVRWDGAVVDGVTSVTPLRASVEVVTLREGGTNAVLSLPGRSAVQGIVVERGVTEDLAFDLWASGPLLRKDVELVLLDPSDQVGVSYRLSGCWVSGYAVSPDLATGVVLESLSLSTDGWKRLTPPAPEVADGLARRREGLVQRVGLGALMTGDLARTERNLTAVLEEAQRSGAVLLFDEADALFSKRSEVKDAHDRFARTEADGIRDVLAQYQGQVVVVPPDGP